MIALLLGRFHAVTAAQVDWLAGLDGDITRIVCVLTSADHAGTRRNPLDAATREAMVSEALSRAKRPFVVVRVDDVPESAAWVEHVIASVAGATGERLAPATTRVYTANHDVDALFARAGYTVVSQQVIGPTPHELIARIVDGKEWRSLASPATIATYERREIVDAVRATYRERLVNDDGELGHARDFASYGAQMDAALRQKLDDLVPFIRPGLIVDKGCGTGMLIVELSRLYPRSAFVGVDLSREFLRRCDENHYAAQDVDFVAGNIIERQVAPGTASTIVFSSVVHEISSYTGYDREQVHRALANAAAELAPGGRLLVRDGVSPGQALVRLRLLDIATRAQFVRFALEFKHGQGAPHEPISDDEVRISAHLANEFICKKDYLKNWHIEVHEEYGTFTVDEWRQALSRAGLRPVEIRAYVNPWIATHRYSGTVELRDENGATLPWPATNVVVVGEKLG